METITMHGLEEFACGYRVMLTYPANSQRISGLSIGEQYPVFNQIMTLTAMEVIDQAGDRLWQLSFEPVGDR